MGYARTIYEILSAYKKEDIDLVISTLSDKDKEIVDLSHKFAKKEIKWSKETSAYFYRSLLPKIKNRLEKMSKRPRLIYTYFPGHKVKDVDEAIEHLKDEYKKIVYLRFGSDLQNPPMLSPKWTSEHSHIFHSHVLVDIDKYLKYKMTGRKVKTIYELIPEYNREQINEAIASLGTEEKELIRKRYGENLDIPNTTENWNIEFLKPFHNLVVPKIRQIIKQKAKTIYFYFPGYSIELIDAAIKTLSNEEQAQLVIGFNYDAKKLNGISLENVTLSKYYKRNIISKLGNKLRKLTGIKPSKTIYDYFQNNTKEEVDKAISLLNDNDKEIIFLKYGADLNNPVTSSEWNSYYSHRFNDVVKKISKILNGSKTLRSTTIYDYFKDISKEQLNGVLVNLPYKDKELIYLKYGDDLMHPQKSQEWTIKHSSMFDCLIKRIKTIIKKTKILEEVLYFENDLEYQEIIKDYKARKYDKKEYIEDYKDRDFGLDVQQKLINILDDLEYQVVSLRYIENFTVNDIAFILFMEVDEVIKILKKAMYLYKKERLTAYQVEQLDIDVKRVRVIQKQNMEE